MEGRPWSPEGRERYGAALRRLAMLLERPWVAEATDGSMVSVLDLGAGRGIGGVALAGLLKGERG